MIRFRLYIVRICTSLITMLVIFGIGSLYKNAIAEPGEAEFNRYRNMLAMIADLDYSATNETLRDLCLLLSSKTYARDSSGNWDTSIYEKLGCINTVVFKKPDVAVSYLLDHYQNPIIILAFEGSTSDFWMKDKNATIETWMEDWRYNVDFWKSNNGIHQGFDNLEGHMREALYDYRFLDLPGQPNFIELMESATDGKGAHFIATGHSLGGALAQVFTYNAIQRAVSNENIVAYTFAPPKAFCLNEISEQYTKNTFIHNYANKYDLVPIVGTGMFVDNGGNLGCTYYLTHELDTAEEIFIQTILKDGHFKITKQVAEHIKKEHDMVLYMALAKTEPSSIKTRDFIPTDMDESIFDDVPIPSNSNMYKPNYFNRVVTVEGLASMLNCYVTTYPQVEKNKLEGLVEYHYDSKVTEVGAYLGSSSTLLPLALSEQINKGEYGDFSTAFKITVPASYIEKGAKYYQVYAIVDGRKYVGRVEPINESLYESGLVQTTSPISAPDIPTESEAEVYTFADVQINREGLVSLHGRVGYLSQSRASRVGILGGYGADQLKEIGFDTELPDINPLDFYYTVTPTFSDDDKYYFQAYADVDGVRYYGDIKTYTRPAAVTPTPQNAENVWDEVETVGGNVSAYRIGELWGIVLSDGEIVSQPIFNWCNLCFCRHGESLGDTMSLVGVIDGIWYSLSSTTGEIYEAHWGHGLEGPLPDVDGGGYQTISANGLCGYARSDGSIVVSPQYIMASDPCRWQNNVYGWVQTSNGWSVLWLE